MRRLQPACAPILESTAPTQPTLSMIHHPICQFTTALLLVAVQGCCHMSKSKGWATHGGPAAQCLPEGHGSCYPRKYMLRDDAGLQSVSVWVAAASAGGADGASCTGRAGCAQQRPALPLFALPAALFQRHREFFALPRDPTAQTVALSRRQTTMTTSVAADDTHQRTI